MNRHVDERGAVVRSVVVARWKFIHTARPAILQEGGPFGRLVRGMGDLDTRRDPNTSAGTVSKRAECVQRPGGPRQHVIERLNEPGPPQCTRSCGGRSCCWLGGLDRNAVPGLGEYDSGGEADDPRADDQHITSG